MALAAHTSRRSRGTAVGLGLLSLVAACAVNLPPPQPRVTDTRNGQATAALPKVERGGSTGEAPYGHGGSAVWEESEIEQAAALAPTRETQAATPTPEQLAAIAPGATPHAAEADNKIGSAAEPESLLSHIGPTTPPNVTAALRLIEDGRQQMRQGRYDQAIDRFERAVAIDPTNAYGYYFLAQLHYRNKQYDQAAAFAGRAASLSARNDRIWAARVYSLQGAVFEDVGRYPDARKAYQKAMDADPNNLAARVGVARLNPQ